MDITVEVKAKPEKFQELYQTFQALVPTFRKAKGCLGCGIYEEKKHKEIFSLSVQWEALENIEHYMESTGGSALIGAIDLLAETARVRMGRDAPWQGIETLKRMRKASREDVRE